ncbi:putative zinc-type alcohol dehydrogenase-like protein [Sinobacterium caligoides]|uniref:alcohol dehydrogenase (NADP(+)) n=1 Tax=Sinobacterium caligoides TaxID=933926 RepID=A0A3N2DKK2_9GAMM|nr:NAD(P)-dependent alcohol dehydrogenase [Sinobacterium caligoides]ROS00232.1 putative zinc-type alcohol dehydrogenase-like protein [Sinobacterium caligoides]
MIKAYAATDAGAELTPYEYDPGPLADGDVEIAVESCGICHSDLSMLDNEWGLSQYPLVPGHEIVGTVAAIGSDVTQLKVGQRVGLGWQSGFCLDCSSCDKGDHNLCKQASFSIIARHGGFADKVRAQANAVVALPENIDAESAGPLFCGGITVFNPLVEFNIKPGDKVAVIGIGGLGHLAIQFLKAWGCHTTAFTSSKDKALEALELGADSVLDSTNAASLAAAADRFDFIISTVNVTLDWNAYIATLAPKGRLHFVGITLENLDIAVLPLLIGQRTISGSPVGSPGTMEKMLSFAAKHQIKPMVEYFDFSDINNAITHLREGKARYRVVLKHPSD